MQDNDYDLIKKLIRLNINDQKLGKEEKNKLSNNVKDKIKTNKLGVLSTKVYRSTNYN